LGARFFPQGENTGSLDSGKENLCAVGIHLGCLKSSTMPTQLHPLHFDLKSAPNTKITPQINLALCTYRIIFAPSIARSSNGRTAVFGTVCGGSNPSRATKALFGALFLCPLSFKPQHINPFLINLNQKFRFFCKLNKIYDCMHRILLLCFLFPLTLVAQTDTEFWFVAPEVQQSHGDRPITVRLSTAQQAASIQITMPINPGFPPINAVIPPNTTQSFDLTLWIDLLENKPADLVLDKALRIVSTTPITAYYEVVTSCNCNPDIFTLKGRNALGTSFMLPFQTFLNNGVGNAWSGFDIVATQPNTSITITPTAAIVGHPAGVPFTINLNMGETWSGISTSQNFTQRPSGTIITADKPIAVTIKDDSMNGGVYGGCADLMGDQMVPLPLLGTDYITIKGYLNGPDRVFVMATQNNTQVTIDGTVVGTINAGQSYTHVQSANTAFIQASLPVYVLHTTGFGCEVGGAVLPTIICTGSQQIGFTRSTTEFFALNLMVKSGGEGNFTLNGNPNLITTGNFAPVPGSNGTWMYAQIQFNTNDIPQGQASLIANASHLFHMGVVNGGASSGCRYGYFSDYSAYQFDASSTTDSLCQGGNLILSANSLAGANYQWTGPNNFSSGNQTDTIFNVSPSISGLYHLTGSVGACPVISDSVFVFIQPTPAPAVAAPLGPVCAGDTAFLSASGPLGAVFQWSGPSGFQSVGQQSQVSGFFTPQTGWYTVVPLINGCPGDSDQVWVSIDSVALNPQTVPPICNNGSTGSIDLNVQSGIAPFTFSWNGNLPPSPQQSNLTPGTYIAVVTDSNGCTATYSVTFANPAPINMTLNASPATCPSSTDGSIQAQTGGGTGPLSFQWSHGPTVQNPPPVSGGWYFVTATDSNGCQKTDSVLVPAPPMLTATFDSVMPPLCYGNSNGFISVMASGGPGGYTYQWIGSGYTQASQGGLPEGSYQIMLVDGLGCDTLILDTSIVAPPPVQVSGLGPNPICQGSPFLLTATGAQTYLWAGGNINGMSSDSVVTSLQQNTTFTVVGWVGPCADTAQVVVSVLPTPQANIQWQGACVNDTLWLDASGSQVGNPAQLQQWFWDLNADGQNDAQQISIGQVFSAPGSPVIRLIVVADNGCIDTLQLPVSVFPLPTAGFLPDVVCFGQNFQPQNTSTIVSGNLPSFSWSFGDGSGGSGQNPSYVYTDTGWFQVQLIAESDKGCVDTAEATIYVSPGPGVVASVLPGCFGLVEFRLEQMHGDSLVDPVTWATGENTQTTGNPINYTYQSGPGSYPVQATVFDIHGCRGESTITADVPDTKTWNNISFPNVITPNGDGLNDELVFDVDIENCSPYLVWVYNRWGRLVFEGGSGGASFRGFTQDGAKLEDGVYQYIVRAADGTFQRVSVLSLFGQP